MNVVTRKSANLVIGGAVVLLLGVAAPARAASRQQNPPPPAPPPAQAEQPPVSPAEIQRMFDAYALMRAEEQLNLNDDQYAPFLSRFKALQDARREGQQQRVRLIQEMYKLLQANPIDEAQLRERLKALQELDSRTAAEIHKAYDGIDQVLDVVQQAKFRVFEEQMERRKLELLTRARQRNRAQPPVRRP